MKFLTLNDVSLANKTVLVRVDLNVPTKGATVTDATRIESILPTLNHLLKEKAKVVLMSHFGRPSGWDSALSLKFIIPVLEKVFQHPVTFLPACVGDSIGKAIKDAPYGSVFLLENLRFYEGEEKNDPVFSKDLAALADVYVNDAFSCSHRAHASVVGVTKYLPSLAGHSLSLELKHLDLCLRSPEYPLTAIVGGSKISTKLELLTNLCEKVDTLIIGGAMANTLLAAQGIDVGKSLYEPNLLDIAARILKNSKAEILLPTDVVIGKDLSDRAQTQIVDVYAIPQDQMALDLGPKTVERIKAVLKESRTVIWNGPVGAFECAPFAEASLEIAKTLADLSQKGSCLSVAGGGDTVAALGMAGVKDKLTYVSAAGGAFLEWLEGKVLPGVEALIGNP